MRPADIVVMFGGMSRTARDHCWAKLSDRELGRVPLCDLRVSLEGSWLGAPIARVQRELVQRGLDFAPHFWVSDEWMTPDGVTGVAVPFYLLNERLLRLEKRQLGHVEGGTVQGSLKLLRHELGHALCNAYQLHKRSSWQRVFGSPATPYPERYRPLPSSKNFVQHLAGWYAQCHPDEDFAETFAVWLKPGVTWRRAYAGWPALAKLEFVDALMKRLREQAPLTRSRKEPYALATLNMTLSEYYEQKRERYARKRPLACERELKRVFAAMPSGSGISAAKFLRSNQPAITQQVCRWTGAYQLNVEQALSQLIARCRELELRAVGPARKLVADSTAVTTLHTLQLVRQRVWHPV